MQEVQRLAAAINLRVQQLEKQGITGGAMVEHMLGHMHDLQRIYETAPDHILAALCRDFPGFYQYASLMEAMSEKNQAMLAGGTHPYGDMPELPEPLKLSLKKLMASAVELERGYQSAIDSGRFADHAGQLMRLKHQWGTDLKELVLVFRSSDVPLRAQAVVQQVLRAMAERIDGLGRKG